MKAALRTCGLLLAPTPTLRVIALLGLALFIGGHLAASSLRSLEMISPLGLVFMLFVPALFGGIFLRMLAARRSSRLIPYYRLSLLAGAAIALLVACSFIALEIALFGIERPSAATHPFFGFALALSFGSMLWIAAFSMTCSPVGYYVVLPLCWLLPRALERYMPRAVGAVIFEPAHLLLFTLLLWTGFAVWFCWRRRIGAVDFANRPNFLVSSPRKVKELQNPAAMLLNPNAESTRWGQKLVPFILVIAFYFLSSRGGTVPPNAFLYPFGGITATVVPFMSAWIVCRRAKWLWLRRADRIVLFRTSEAVIWRQSILGLLSLLVLVPVSVWLAPGQTTGLIFVIVGVAIALPCNVYLGLCWTRSVNAIDLLLTTVLGLYSILVFVITSFGTISFTFVLTMTSAPVVAFSLRRLALSRWSTIDWLDAKPPRNSSGLWRQTT